MKTIDQIMQKELLNQFSDILKKRSEWLSDDGFYHVLDTEIMEKYIWGSGDNEEVMRKAISKDLGSICFLSMFGEPITREEFLNLKEDDDDKWDAIDFTSKIFLKEYLDIAKEDFIEGYNESISRHMIDDIIKFSFIQSKEQ